MNNSLQELIIENTPIGYASHHFTTDEEGHVNYVFAEANSAFYQLFNLSSNTDVDCFFSGQGDLGFNWKAFWNKAVIDNSDNEVEVFNTHNKTWLRISVYIAGDCVLVSSVVNITEKKVGKHNLFESEQRFRSLLAKVSGLSVMGCKKDGTITFLNQACENLYGFSSAEAINANVFDLLVPKGLCAIRRKFFNSIVEGESDVNVNLGESKELRNFSQGINLDQANISSSINNAEEIYLKHKRGNIIPVFSNHVVVSSSINDKEIFFIDVDMSKLKDTEALLKKMSLATEQSPASIIVTDILGNIEYVNPKFCKLTGFEAGEVLGLNPRILKSGLTSPETYRQLWQTISMGEEWHGEMVNKKKCGDFYYESAVISPIVNEDGVITNFVAVKEDITGRVLAQQTVMQQSNNLALLLDISQSLISTIDLNNLLQLIINHGAGLIDVEGGAIYTLEKDMAILKATSPKLPLDFPSGLCKGNIENFPHMFNCITSKEPLVVVDLTKEKFSDAEKLIMDNLGIKSMIFLPLIINDSAFGMLALSTSKINRMFSQIEVDLCQTLASLASLAINNALLFEKSKESERLKTAFLQNMSHEIRTPMNGILGFSKLLKNKDLSNEVREKYATFIIESTNQLLTIVDDIMDVSIMETGAISLNNNTVIIEDLLYDIYLQYKPKIKNDIVLEVVRPSLSNRTVIVDERRLEQVLCKLLDNAIKFTNYGTVSFGCERENDKLTFFVSDTGIGIYDDNIEKIFEPFFQISMDANREYGGNGLGLTIASKIVETMGGNMIVKSVVGKGTIFYFELDCIS
jgi:PAS domain S-box-containing protein